MKNEKWDDVHGNTTPDDRMVAFLESPTDSYAILQLREDVDDNIPLMFANYSYLQKKEMEPEIDRYEVVYHGSISMSEDVNRQLEDLYVKPVYTADKPSDCHYCYFWTNGRKGCRLGRNNCYYLISLPPKPKSECDGCPYGRDHPCIGWCTKKVMREVGLR
ncbi:MAG: YodL domain-containing protein [Oscillospiraceae bacterium]